MRQWKKIVYGLILVWTGVLASLIMSENAFAQTEVTEDGFYYSINEDGKTVTIIDYNRETSSGDITIPSAIDGKTVTRIGDGAFAEGVKEDFNNTNPTTPSQRYPLHATNGNDNGVSSATYDYTHLRSITIPDSVTSIGNDAFLSCSRLININIPDSVISIGNSAFYCCHTLISIAIPNSVTLIGNETFSYCTRLSNITISDCATSIGNQAFYHCSNLTNITIPGSVTSIGNLAFCHCHELSNVTILNGVTSIGDYAFYNCYKVTYYDNNIEKWSGLRTISIPDSVTFIGNGAFKNCHCLTDITIPNSVASIGDETFYNCSKLSNITILNGVTSIGNNAFYRCKNLTDITIPGSVISIGESAFVECTHLTNVIFLNGITSIGVSAFSDCSELTSITIPVSVTSIGEGAFSCCEKLTGSITISGNNTSIGVSAFSGCSELNNITISGNNTSIGVHAFSGCHSLNNITISGNNTSIGVGAFSGCHSLNNIILLNGVISIDDGAFSRCDNLQTAIIPNSIMSLGYDVFNGSGYYNDKYNTIDVYYTGSQSNWEKISNPLFDYQADIAMHFNSTFPKQISLDTSTTNFSIREPLKLSATITPTDVTANKIIWRICNNNADIHFTDENIAGQDFAVGKEIEITADSSGTAIITAQTANGLTTSVEVTVTDSSDNPCDIQGHKEEVMPAINATCTDNGYTQGIYCTVCGQILFPQEVISALGHTWSEWATIGNISETRHCTVCGQTETRTKQSTNPPVSNDPLPSTPKPAPTTRPTSTPIPRPDRKVPSNIKKVTKLTVKNKKKKTATLSWKKVTNADGYELQYATSKKFRSSKKKKTPNTKISIKKLKKGKIYYFRVRAYKKQGKKTIYGKWSNVKKIKIRK